jgi:formylglycine-generating enzyme required for sulfatase activity
MPERIFISYSRKDSEFVLKLRTDLHSAGLSTWIDQHDIQSGTEWMASIVKGIKGCSITIAVLSPNSVASGAVIRELSLADENKHMIIPLKYKPTELAEPMEYILAGRQWLDFMHGSYPENLVRLLKVLPPARILKIKNPIEMEFVLVPKGRFLMGSQPDNELADGDEKPQHLVEVSYFYWIARFPVTKAQYQSFVEKTGRQHTWVKDWQNKLNHPVVNVTWEDAQAFCLWLTESKTGLLDGYCFRLPTEAERERAARDKDSREWPWGNDWDANFCNSSESQIVTTTPVGSYSPEGDSPCGAADMAGNVWEWCSDWYDAGEYDRRLKDQEEVIDPIGPVVGDTRAVRGGSYCDSRWFARGASRFGFNPNISSDMLGFRVVASLIS